MQATGSHLFVFFAVILCCTHHPESWTRTWRER